MTSALASLTATYTDSDEALSPDAPPEEEVPPPETAPIRTPPPDDNNSTPDTSRSITTSQPASPALVRVTTRVGLAKLVSYHDDTLASDEEGELDEAVPHQMILMEEKSSVGEVCHHDDDMIPAEPPGHCSGELQEKINKLYEKMQTQQLDMNMVIQKRKDFRNPSIYEKLIQFCDLDELGTNYPPSIYDPLKWGKDSYYEELARVQKVEMDKREKERKGKIEFLSGTKKQEDEKKRKSKWDQPGGGGSVSALKPAGLIQPSLTTTATGTKGTVISAFGSLPKKPRP